MTMRRAASVLAAVSVLAGCQFPGILPPRQQQAAVPRAVPKPPPQERGIWIVGSRALEGRIQAASERFGGGEDTRPHLIAEGVAPGFRSFCGGVGLEFPDMVVSDRPARADEAKRCRDKGIRMTEYELGPKQYVYVKDAHMSAVPGVRDFVESWGVAAKES